MQQSSDKADHYFVMPSLQSQESNHLFSTTIQNPQIVLERDKNNRRIIRIGSEYFILINKITREEAQKLSQLAEFPLIEVNNVTEAEKENKKGGRIVFIRGEATAKPILGQGGFGKVRIAIRKPKNGPQSYVAVKKIKDPDAISASRNEAVLQKKVSGKTGIMPLYEFIETLGNKTKKLVLYQFMPLASMGDAEHLKTYLAEHPEQSLKIQTFLHVAKNFLLGLWNLHQANIYHLDVKPSNIGFSNELKKMFFKPVDYPSLREQLFQLSKKDLNEACAAYSKYQDNSTAGTMIFERVNAMGVSLFIKKESTDEIKSSL